MMMSGVADPSLIRSGHSMSRHDNCACESGHVYFILVRPCSLYPSIIIIIIFNVIIIDSHTRI